MVGIYEHKNNGYMDQDKQHTASKIELSLHVHGIVAVRLKVDAYIIIYYRYTYKA